MLQVSVRNGLRLFLLFSVRVSTSEQASCQQYQQEVVLNFDRVWEVYMESERSEMEKVYSSVCQRMRVVVNDAVLRESKIVVVGGVKRWWRRI